ncbi:MAG: hypothetical protein IPF53_15880 [Blastocatellia bacterium]|nr:hypothetical protein [Blastocatellia bacterium]
MSILLAISFSAYTAGVVGSLALRGSWARGAASVFGLAGAVAGAVAGAMALATMAPVEFALVSSGPLGALQVSIDALSGFFLVLTGLVGAAAAVYAFGYTGSYRGRYSERTVGAVLNVLLLSFTGVVVAANGLTFLVAWELMVMATFVGVLTEHRQEGTVAASVWYIALSHVAFVAIVPLLLMVAGGDLTASFSEARGIASSLSPTMRDAAFLLALAGFGIKAGLVPLHAWLPLAHPVAPSHISALMSGVAIKIAIYGFVRIVFVVLGTGPVWWGVVVLAIGAASALLGVLYALMEHDLKRLLAFHSVENIGIIAMALGAALLFGGYGRPDLAWLGLAAGLFHTINHAAFKSLLFLAAGSVLHATHTRNIEELGGLAKRMPWTSGFFLLGSAAISALPPLNGFASEWLVFQSLLSGFEVEEPRRDHRDTGRGRHARADRRAGRRVFRQGVRDHVSRHGAFDRGRTRARVADVHARGNGPARGGVPRARNRRSSGDADPWPDRRNGSEHAGRRDGCTRTVRPCARNRGELLSAAPRRMAHRDPGSGHRGAVVVCRPPSIASRADLGVRPIRLDAANAVHRDGIRRAAPTDLRGDLPADGGPVGGLSSRLEVLRELDRVPKRDSRPLQGDRLRSRDFACAGDFLEGSADSGRLGAPLHRLRRRSAPRRNASGDALEPVLIQQAA